MIFNLIYDMLLVIFALISLPKLLYQRFFNEKYRFSIPRRLGLRFPHIEKKQKKIIWVHAVSMGETKAVSSIVRRIKKNNPGTIVITSSVTETGYAEAKRSMPEADYNVFLPLDFMWIVRPIIKKVSPDIVILCETDLWFNFLKCCKSEGASVYLVNGKISKRSLQRYKKLSWYTKHLFPLIDKFCVQSEHYKQRFLEIGIPKDKIFVTGNIKFDGNYLELSKVELAEWKQKLGVPADNYVLVVGSTHYPEEKLVLNVLKEIWKEIPNISVLLVPRHPERFDEVASFLKKRGILFNRYSQLSKEKKDCKVVLMDSMGILRQCYQLADIALVAGSYTSKVGGHSIIEPAWYGVPVIYGPHMHAQPELVELVEKYQAGLQVAPEQLRPVISRLFSTSNERKKLGHQGRIMARELQGAAKKTYQKIFEKDFE